MSALGMNAQRALGNRLRDLRKSLGLSLMGVEEKSLGRWKAVVIGSYERGDRAVTVARLFELADFYHVQPWDLLMPADPSTMAAALSEGMVLAEAQRHARTAADLLARLFDGGEPQ